MSAQELRKNFVVALSLGVVLGLGWGFGLVATSSDLVALTFTFQVIFSIFVGSQGVLIFVFHGLRNAEFREFWKKCPQKTHSKLSSSVERTNTAKVNAIEQDSIALSTLPKKV